MMAGGRTVHRSRLTGKELAPNDPWDVWRERYAFFMYCLMACIPIAAFIFLLVGAR